MIACVLTKVIIAHLDCQNSHLFIDDCSKHSNSQTWLTKNDESVVQLVKQSPRVAHGETQ